MKATNTKKQKTKIVLKSTPESVPKNYTGY